MEQNGNITLQTERAEGNVEVPEKINGTETNNIADGGASDSNARIVGAEVAANDGISDERRAEREEYDRLIRTRFKDFYTEDTQRMINRRFRHYKALAEKYKVLEESFSSPAAPKLTDDEVIERIKASGAEISSKHPTFSLEKAIGSEQFISLAKIALEQGSISLSQAYKLSHFDEILAAERERIEREVEQRVTDRIKSNRQRQHENAVQPRSRGVGVKASNLTRTERAELARRAANGEKIGF